MKIGCWTTEAGPHLSGGLITIFEIFNALTKMGHECVLFLDNPPFRSDHVRNEFVIKSSNEIDKFDGILISPFSPTVERVAKCQNAEDRLWWCHSNEACFRHNGEEWTQNAIAAFEQPIKIFTVSSYLQIIMEQIYDRYVIQQLVPPGVDLSIFNSSPQNQDRIRIAIWKRDGWVRGYDVAALTLKILMDKYGKLIDSVVFGYVPNRHQLADMMRSVDIFIDGSRLCGSAVYLKEFQACGTIIFGPKYGTTDFTLDGYNGFIIPVDQPVNIASKVGEVIERGFDYRQQIANNAAQYVKRFSWDNIAQDFIKALEEAKIRGDELLQFRKW